MYDPARTVSARSGKTSALTGKAVWSWVGSKLVVWEIGGHAWMPDKIIDDMFDADEKWSPVLIGVEEDGLNEFIFQPLRQKMVLRGHSLPIRAMKAPKGKIDFIKGLQPFGAAGELVFAQELPSDVKNQFLNFPTGVIDAPNALAYALKMRPGQPMYQSFGVQHIGPELEVQRGGQTSPLWLALNATQVCTTGVLIQFDNGTLRVYADWVTEDPPGASLRHIIQMASLAAGGRVKLGAGAQHFGEFENVGLRAAARTIPVEVQKLGLAYKGREEFRALFSRQPGGRVPVRVSTSATWTLRALSGGYARAYDKRGQLEEFAVEGPYQVLMEGIESLLALTNIAEENDDNPRHFAYTKDGRRYVSALARVR
jgi:hypothetical protein